MWDSIEGVTRLQNQVQLGLIILAVMTTFGVVANYLVGRRLGELQGQQDQANQERLLRAERHIYTADGVLIGGETEYTIYEGGTDRQNLDLRDPDNRSIKWHIEFFSEAISGEGFDLRVFAEQQGRSIRFGPEVIFVTAGDTIPITGTPFQALLLDAVETGDETLNYATFTVTVRDQTASD